MFQIDLANVIGMFKDTLLPHSRTSFDKDAAGYYEGLLFHADCSMSELQGTKDVRKSIFFVLCRNVSVFCAITDGPSGLPNLMTLNWENTSNHDSCWRSDGLERPINQLYFDMAEEVNKNIAPKDLHSFVYTCFQFVKRCRVKVESVGDYRYKLVDVKRDLIGDVL